MLKLENICRVCLINNESEQEVLSLFSDVFCINAFLPIAQIFVECTSIYVYKNDGLPSKICKNCVRELEKSYKFRLKCQRADETLRDGQFIFDSEFIKQIQFLNETEFLDDLNGTKSEDDLDLNSRIQKKKNINKKKLKRDAVKKRASVKIEHENVSNPNAEHLNGDYINDEHTNHQYEKIDKRKEPRIGKVSCTAEKPDGVDDYVMVIDGKPVVKRKPYRKNEMASSNQLQDLITCEQCKRTYKTMQAYKAHMNLHLGVFAFKCDICPQKFTAYRYLREHKKRHILSGNVIMQRNGPTNIKEQISKEKLSIDDIDDNKLMMIQSIDVSSSNERILDENLRLAAIYKYKYNSKSKMPIECQVCHQKLANKQVYENHMNTHMGLLPYQCHICDKKFSGEYHLKGHLKRHDENRKRFLCNLCDSKYKSKQALRTHLRAHSKDRPFKCELCGAGFKSTNTLRVHQSFQHGIKRRIAQPLGRFVCEICEANYSKEYSLEIHLKKHANNTEHDFSCPICQKQHLNEHRLLVHCRVHKPVKREKHQCPICMKVLTRRLQDHMRAHSNVRPFQCGACQMQFRFKTSLGKHRRLCKGYPLQTDNNVEN